MIIFSWGVFIGEFFVFNEFGVFLDLSFVVVKVNYDNYCGGCYGV